VSDVPERLRTALAEGYDVQQEIGRGGMATVYLARDRKHDRQVALKVLKPELALVVGAERFVREIRIAAALRHPNILPLFDSGDANGTLYYTMPFVPGESLRGRLDRERQLPLGDAVTIALEVADALAHAHSHGIVHRDVKPENVLLEAGHAVVADFGIARAVGDMEGRLTETGLAVGTPAYMSPEQAGGTGEVDARADQYALGCVLYEMLAGEPPHTGPTPQAVLARSLTEDVRSLRPVRRTVSLALDAVIRRGLAPTPADRYATCHEFAEALRTAAAAGAGEALVAPSRVRLVRRVLGPTLAVLAIVALGLLGRRLLTPTPAVAASRLGLAVFPFRETDPGPASLSEWLGDLLSTALEGTPGVRVADPWSLWRSLRPDRSAPATPPDPIEGERLAMRAGVRHYVLGAVLQRGEQLDATLRLYEVGTPEPTHTVTATGSVEDLPALVQELAVAIITRLWELEGMPEVRDIQGYTTRSADALKAYLDARLAMRRGMGDSAETAIDRALALDSTFALALVEAIGIKSWVQFLRGEFFSGLRDLAERAVRSSDSLGERNRLRARASLAAVRTEGVRAAEATSRILEIDSTDHGAWSSLAYYHAEYGWQYGADEYDAREAAERAVQLDSTYVPALVQRAWLSVVFEDLDDIRLQIARLRQVDTAQGVVRGTLVALRAILAPDSAFPSLADTIASATSGEWLTAHRYLRFQRPSRDELLLDKLHRQASPGRPQRAALGELARLKIAEGRLAEMDAEITAGTYQAEDLYKNLNRFLVAASIAGVGHPPAAARAVDWLMAYIPPDSALFYFETRPVWWTLWLVAAYHAQFGDTTVTRRWQRTLGTLPAGGTPADYRGGLQRDLDARIAARRGDFDTALREAREAVRLWSIHTGNDWEALASPAMRFHLGMLLDAAGQPDSAATLFRSLVPPATWMGFLTARASYELGRLAERRGDFAEAARYYLSAVRLWERGGPEVTPWRESAQEALRRVVARTG